MLFCPLVRASDGEPKDTLRNVRETGEFVVNIVAEALAEAVNLTPAELPHGEGEFTLAGLEMVPSAVVRPPRVAASPVHFERRVTDRFEMQRPPPGSSRDKSAGRGLPASSLK